MGIGVAFFTEAVGAGPRKDMDILGFGMADGVELRGVQRERVDDVDLPVPGQHLQTPAARPE